jgi:DNA-binding MarR family transcriptional regulator
VNDIGVATDGSAGDASRPQAASAPSAEARAEAADLLAAISAVRRTSRRAARHAWATEPLPTAQSELLRLIARRPGVCVADAAHDLRLAPNTVSTLVGRLAEQGLLRRERSLPDSRSVRLTITDKARRRLEEWRDLRAELASEVLATMTAEDRQALAGAIPALIRLAGRMEHP